MNGNAYSIIERIFYLMVNPDTSLDEYMRRFETSRRAYYRDKEFIRNRVFFYKMSVNDRAL